jgi:hypothetical protein
LRTFFIPAVHLLRAFVTLYLFCFVSYQSIVPSTRLSLVYTPSREYIFSHINQPFRQRTFVAVSEGALAMLVFETCLNAERYVRLCRDEASYTTHQQQRLQQIDLITRRFGGGGGGGGGEGDWLLNL